MTETTIKLTQQEYNNFKEYGFDNKPFVVEREDKYRKISMLYKV